MNEMIAVIMAIATILTACGVWKIYLLLEASFEALDEELAKVFEESLSKRDERQKSEQAGRILPN